MFKCWENWTYWVTVFMRNFFAIHSSFRASLSSTSYIFKYLHFHHKECVWNVPQWLKARTRIFPHCFAWSRVQNSNGFVLNAACCWLLGARVNISTRIKSTQFNWLNVNLAGDRGKCWSFLANKCKLHGFSVVSFEYCLVELMTSHPEWLWWGGKMCSTDWPHYRSKNWCKTVD